jgi:hypothetical protein
LHFAFKEIETLFNGREKFLAPHLEVMGSNNGGINVLEE